MRSARGFCSSCRRAPPWSPAATPRGRLTRSGSTSCSQRPRLSKLLAARPLRRTDLVAPAADGAAAERDATNLRDRAGAARTRVQAISQAVTAALAPLESPGSAAPTTLAAARSAVSSALAVGATLHLANPWAEADLASALRGAAAELGGRLAAPAPAPHATVDDLAAALKALLGANQPARPACARRRGCGRGDGRPRRRRPVPGDDSRSRGRLARRRRRRARRGRTPRGGAAGLRRPDRGPRPAGNAAHRRGRRVGRDVVGGRRRRRARGDEPRGDDRRLGTRRDRARRRGRGLGSAR